MLRGISEAVLKINNIDLTVDNIYASRSLSAIKNNVVELYTPSNFISIFVENATTYLFRCGCFLLPSNQKFKQLRYINSNLGGLFMT